MSATPSDHDLAPTPFRAAGFRVRGDDGTWHVTVSKRRSPPPDARIEVRLDSAAGDGLRLRLASAAYTTPEGRPALDLHLTLCGRPLAGVGLGDALRLALARVMPRLAHLARSSRACAQLFEKLRALPLRLGTHTLEPGVEVSRTVSARWRDGRVGDLVVAP